MDEKAFKHLYTAFLQSEPRDEALDVVAWAKSFDHDQVLVPGPAHVTDLISSIIAWAENMQQPQQPLQAAPQQLLPLGGTSPARDAFPDLRLRSLSPDPSDRLQNPAEQQSAFTGQFWHDTEGSDYSEQPHGPSCHQAEAALGTTQDAALGARTVSLSAGLDMYSAADMPNQYVPQRTPVRDDQPPWSVVDYTAASSQAMSLHNAVVGEMMHMRPAKGSCKFSRVHVHHTADAISPVQGIGVSPWICACPTVTMWLQVP